MRRLGRVSFAALASASTFSCLLFESFGTVAESIHDAAPSAPGDERRPSTPVDAGHDAGDGVLTTFKGEAGSLVPMNGYVYFTADSKVWACSSLLGCSSPTSIFERGSQPRSMAKLGNVIAWTDTPEAALYWCGVSELTPCRTSSSFNDQNGIGAITEGSPPMVFFLRAREGGAETELRRYSTADTRGPELLAVIPAQSQEQALVHLVDELTFVVLGGVPYSVYRFYDNLPVQTRPAYVNRIGGSELASVRGSGVTFVNVRLDDGSFEGRVVWIHNTAQGGELYACPLAFLEPDGGEKTAPCDPARATRFAGRGDEVTALTGYGDRLVWAEAKGNAGAIYACVTTSCSTPTLVKSGIGRVSTFRMAFANAGGGPLYYIASSDGEMNTLGSVELPP
jgi:hypothetical protein